MEVEKTKKELALGVIDSLQIYAKKYDKEMIRLKRLENPATVVAGESAIEFQLRTLRELVQEL